MAKMRAGGVWSIDRLCAVGICNDGRDETERRRCPCCLMLHDTGAIIPHLILNCWTFATLRHSTALSHLIGSARTIFRRSLLPRDQPTESDCDAAVTKLILGGMVGDSTAWPILAAVDEHDRLGSSPLVSLLVILEFLQTAFGTYTRDVWTSAKVYLSG